MRAPAQSADLRRFRPEDAHAVIRAAPRLVRLLALAAFCAVAAVPFPILLGPLFVMIGALAVFT
ncbi:MAG TPA: hypothetical protein VNF29_05895, partial [Candidatus Binataceae bacterium]|nr:hypothetical protein [Candidatus Binataceae bacterium]